MIPLAHGTAPPAPSWPEVLGTWPFEPLVWFALGLAAWAYLSACRRVPAFRAVRAKFFLAGLAVAFVALASPLAAYADALFSVHMIQHLLLTMVAVPLVLLGAPVTLALRAAAPQTRARLSSFLHSRVIRVLGHPATAWITFAAVMWITHFTPFFDAALESGVLHAVEHTIYVVAAALFWWPVIGLDPGANRLSPAARLGYLFLAMPQQAFLGLAIYSSDELLYPHYATLRLGWGPDPLADQRAAGMIMWIGGDALFLVALAFAGVAWMRHDLREAERVDRRLDRG